MSKEKIIAVHDELHRTVLREAMENPDVGFSLLCVTNVGEGVKSATTGCFDDILGSLFAAYAGSEDMREILDTFCDIREKYLKGHKGKIEIHKITIPIGDIENPN